MGKELFGTDGIRGIPGTEPLDDATLYATGRALGLYLRREHAAPRVLIGLYTRESGPHLAAMIAAGLATSGVKVAFAGVITTPAVAGWARTCLPRTGSPTGRTSALAAVRGIRRAWKSAWWRNGRSSAWRLTATPTARCSSAGRAGWSTAMPYCSRRRGI